MSNGRELPTSLFIFEAILNLARNARYEELENYLQANNVTIGTAPFLSVNRVPMVIDALNQLAFEGNHEAVIAVCICDACQDHPGAFGC